MFNVKINFYVEVDDKICSYIKAYLMVLLEANGGWMVSLYITILGDIENIIETA